MSNINGVVHGTNTIIGNVNSNFSESVKNKLQGDLHTSLNPVDNHIPFYNGSYQITPTLEAQELQTSSRILENNIRVLGIPFSETVNSSGGKTAVIGG